MFLLPPSSFLCQHSSFHLEFCIWTSFILKVQLESEVGWWMVHLGQCGVIGSALDNCPNVEWMCTIAWQCKCLVLTLLSSGTLCLYRDIYFFASQIPPIDYPKPFPLDWPALLYSCTVLVWLSTSFLGSFTKNTGKRFVLYSSFLYYHSVLMFKTSHIIFL